MEAATPLPFAQVRVVGGRLYVDGLVVDDECSVRLAGEAEDPAALVTDAIEIGARVLDREQTGANAEFVKAEFERAARDLDKEFVDRARAVAERLDAKVDEVFGDERGHVTQLLARHLGDESSVAVQNRVKALLAEAQVQLREDLRKQFSSQDAAANPIAGFQQATLGMMKQHSQIQADQLRLMTEQMQAMELRIAELKAEKEKLTEVAAVAEKGTAKGRTYEQAVHDAIDRIAAPQGDDCEAVGDLKESTGRKGDIVVHIGACEGATRGRIVFEAKNARMTRPKALEELDGALRERNAEYAVLVVPDEDKVPAKMLSLREYNGDKLIVAFDPEDGQPLALELAYKLARARVLMSRAGDAGLDTGAVHDTVERALQAFEEVRRIKQQLTGAKTQIDKAGEIVDTLADKVKGHLHEIDELLEAGAA
jgi:methyl-accepting chemotaxis protein